MFKPYKTGDIIYKKSENGDENWVVYVRKKDVKKSVLPIYSNSMNGYVYDEERRHLIVVNIKRKRLIKEYSLYKGDIPSSQRLLIPLSNYLKGKIDLILFLHAYCKLFFENNQTADKSNSCVDWYYTNEQLELTGIEYKFEEEEEGLSLMEAFLQISEIIDDTK